MEWIRQCIATNTYNLLPNNNLASSTFVPTNDPTVYCAQQLETCTSQASNSVKQCIISDLINGGSGAHSASHDFIGYCSSLVQMYGNRLMQNRIYLNKLMPINFHVQIRTNSSSTFQLAQAHNTILLQNSGYSGVEGP